jgi:hypothetical protein
MWNDHRQKDTGAKIRQRLNLGGLLKRMPQTKRPQKVASAAAINFSRFVRTCYRIGCGELPRRRGEAVTGLD